MKEYMLCTSCKMPHIEDCSTCFGFGVTNGGAPVAAGDAHRGDVPVWSICPECGSTAAGYPGGGDDVVFEIGEGCQPLGQLSGRAAGPQPAGASSN